jgi:hypothetical protein
MSAATPLPGGLYPIIRRARRPMVGQEPITAPPAPAPTPERPKETVGDGDVAATEPVTESKDQRAEDCKY